MPAVSSFSFYPLSILTRRRGANTAHIIIVSPKEHPGLGAACARRHWAFLRARARDGTSNAPEPTEDEAEPDPEPGPEADMDEPDDAEPTAAEYDEFFNSILAM